MRKFLLWALLIVIISGCKTGDVSESRQNSRLLHDIWVLESMQTSIINVDAERRPMLELYVDEMRVSGSDGCNRISGKIEMLDEKHLKFGMIASTRRACPDMTIPDIFTKALSEVRQYRRQGLKLFLMNSIGQEILQFKKVDQL